MVLLYAPALIGALLITVLEMTEVVALVFALGIEGKALRMGVLGALAGTALVSLLAVGSATVILALPRGALLGAAAGLLGAFGTFLFRSTLKSFRRARKVAPEATGATPAHPPTVVHFAGGFSVGAVETLEAVIVLLALAAAGYGASAVIGAVAGGLLLVGLAWGLHGQIRRIKLPWLKLGATALLFSFAVFWAGEALGRPWPLGDLILIPLFVGGILLVRAGLELFLRRDLQVEPNR